MTLTTKLLIPDELVKPATRLVIIVIVYWYGMLELFSVKCMRPLVDIVPLAVIFYQVLVGEELE